MRTRPKEMLSAGGFAPAFTFEFTLNKHGGAWKLPRADGKVILWSTPALRDRARDCFTSRRSVEAAMADLRRARLIPAGIRGGSTVKDPTDAVTMDLPLKRQKREPAVKPVRLQVNTRGAWRDVIDFDAANDTESAEVMDAAARLGAIAHAAFRIVMTGPEQHPRSPEVLTYWHPGACAWSER